MRGFLKTLFGDSRHVCVAASCVGVAALLLRTPLAAAAGLVLPAALMAGAAYLARH